MSRKNKVRYKSKGNPYPIIVMTGRVFLRHDDEEELKTAVKGDIQVFISTDSLLGRQPGDYETMGFEGYLKADVYDGKGWKPMSLEELFPGREYYFGKRERPRDTYLFCLNALKATTGTRLMRTYREHYVKVADDALGLEGEDGEEA